ncbi:YjjG family noncanonical pyrimidine nucleotidase [Fructilactobacillus sp. Tb1]|uniref:YjjG family noncanonical pyrimidine nucleotidase n=1 Tax=Fructilactobacillus sp. Tb1 TaxID=3422304 RepID=UPI003D2B35B3
MYKYVIFDLDDTILDFHRGEIEGVTAILKEYKVPDIELGLKKYIKINNDVWSQIEDGAALQPLLDSRFTKVMAYFGIKVDGQAVEKEYREMINHNYHKIAGVDKLLKKLADSDVKVVAGSNGFRKTQVGRLKGADLYQYFDQVNVSEDVGVAKPDSKFFEHIFKLNPGMTKENVIMVGDGVKSDILGANRFGIDSIWYNPNHKPMNPKIKPTYEVDNYQDMYDIIVNK